MSFQVVDVGGQMRPAELTGEPPQHPLVRLGSDRKPTCRVHGLPLTPARGYPRGVPEAEQVWECGHPVADQCSTVLVTVVPVIDEEP